MTVAELIEELQNVPQDMEVEFKDSEFIAGMGCYGAIVKDGKVILIN